jgi:tetratricopeptide (TPR) repeat protein
LIELAKQAIYRSQGNEALALTEEAHQIYKSMGARAPTVEMANAITGIGYSLKELNRVDEAVKALDGAIELLREGSYPFVVDTLRTKASWLVDIGQYEDAIATYLEATQVNEIEGEFEFFARDLLAISVCYTKMSKWPEVIEHASRARDNFKKEKFVDEVAWCDVQIANAYAESGNAEFALDIGQRAYDLGDLRKQLAIKCNAALVMGKSYVLTEKFEDAETRFEEAREIVSGSNDWETIVKIEKEFINLYLVQGRVETAAEVERRLKSLQEIVE